MARVFRKKVNEGMISGSVGMSPTFAASYGVQGISGYVYSIKPLSFDLQGGRHPVPKAERLIHVGSRIKSKSKKGNTVVGRIQRIVKNSDGYITNVLVFNEKNARVTPVSIDDIILLESYAGRISKRLPGKYTPGVALLCETVKRDGPVTVEKDGGRYMAVLNEGIVKIATILDRDGKEEVVTLNSVLDTDPNILKEFTDGIE